MISLYSLTVRTHCTQVTSQRSKHLTWLLISFIISIHVLLSLTLFYQKENSSVLKCFWYVVYRRQSLTFSSIRTLVACRYVVLPVWSGNAEPFLWNVFLRRSAASLGRDTHPDGSESYDLSKNHDRKWTYIIEDTLNTICTSSLKRKGLNWELRGIKQKHKLTLLVLYEARMNSCRHKATQTKHNYTFVRGTSSSHHALIKYKA